MKKVLYLTNIETPYRVRFFNELSKYCDLTVLYEKRSVEERNEIWAKSEQTCHKRKFLRRESVFFSGVWKELRGGYDTIIVGCYNNPVQMLGMLYMRLCGIPFIINLDGEPYLNGRGIKTALKKFVLGGAQAYLVAGKKAAASLRSVARNKTIVPYYFSSLSELELKNNGQVVQFDKRNRTVLVIGQYLDFKGMDVALEAARMDMSIKYKFVGMGSRTELFLKEHEIPLNVEIIPFLQKTELEKEYQSCGMLVLPSRQECWGLVINEAASFGMPIVSTWGSGAAVEFLADEYPQYLAQPGDAVSLYHCVCACMDTANKNEYCQYLLTQSQNYSIEHSARKHLLLLQ